MLSARGYWGECDVLFISPPVGVQLPPGTLKDGAILSANTLPTVTFTRMSAFQAGRPLYGHASRSGRESKRRWQTNFPDKFHGVSMAGGLQ